MSDDRKHCVFCGEADNSSSVSTPCLSALNYLAADTVGNKPHAYLMTVRERAKIAYEKAKENFDPSDITFISVDSRPRCPCPDCGARRERCEAAEGCGRCKQMADALELYAAEYAKEERERGALAMKQAVLDALWGRIQREEYGHAKAAVALDIEAVNALDAKVIVSEIREGGKG